MFRAASLSIEPFEVSRSRLRRTRQLSVCILNRVLVLARRLRWKYQTAVGAGER